MNVSTKGIGKACLWALGLACVAILSLRIIGHLSDEEALSETGLLALPIAVKQDNAYLMVAEACLENSEFNNAAPRIGELAKKWQLEPARALIQAHRQCIGLFEASSSLPAFQSVSSSPIELPDFQALGLLSKLNLIKVKVLSEDQNYLQAAEQLVNGLKFNRLVQNDANATLLAYMVGGAYQAEYLRQIAEFAANDRVPIGALELLSVELQALGDFESDGFELVWSGEHRYSKALIESQLDESIIEKITRFGFYMENVDDNNSLSIVSEFVESLAWAIIPEYIVQTNKVNNRALKFWRKAQGESNKLCVNNPSFNTVDPKPESKWAILKPNSVGQAYYPVPDSDFLQFYFDERCVKNFWVNASRLLLLIKLYEKENATDIVELSRLIPKYLEALPIDPFSGVPIEFNAHRRILFSHGANRQNDGGSLSDECDDYKCINNPALFIGPPILREQKETAGTNYKSKQ
jgi:hypothetical protein